MAKPTEKESEVEYLDAQPIEGSGAPPPSAAPPPQAQAYTYYKRSDTCIPCCGPLGCMISILLGLALLGRPQLLINGIYLLLVFMLISFLLRLLFGRS